MSSASRANTPSKSRSLVAWSISSLNPSARAAGWSSRVCVAALGLVGLTSAPRVVAVGTTLCSSSSRFGSSSTLSVVTPVRLPPGRFRLATSPSATGSAPVRKTTGMVLVAALAASTPSTWPATAITATLRLTRSAASAGSRSFCSSAQRYSIATLRPST